MLPLFEQFPGLREELPHIPLADLPTPVQRLERLGAALGLESLYIKRDDISATPYGGNKPRKLEFILADALRSGATHVMTFGAAGSNHALATAVYARLCGLRSISMLGPQPNAEYVRRNLLMSLAYGAELHVCGAETASLINTTLEYAATMHVLLHHRMADGRMPYRIPPGGSSPHGTMGYVNAGLELGDQVRQGTVPEPDVLYVACGTLGTAAGLVLGLKVAGLRTRVIAVKVATGPYVRPRNMRRCVESANRFIASFDHSFPLFPASEFDSDIRDEYAGHAYALFTQEGTAATRLMREHEGLVLDGTYTGKTLAALIGDAREGRLRSRTVLFWNTYNSRDFSGSIQGIDYHGLPRAFHRYFEEPVQPLDGG